MLSSVNWTGVSAGGSGLGLGLLNGVMIRGVAGSENEYGVTGSENVNVVRRDDVSEKA